LSPILQVSKLKLAYGDVVVCPDVSFEVGKGEIVTLIGANGAGKSTIMRAVAGLMTASSGSIRFNGQDITKLEPFQRALGGIALVPEGRHVFPYLSVLENLEMGGFKYRNDAPRLRRLIDQMMDMFPRLRERSSQHAGTLSGGEQQMLVLGRALMSEPKLLCLDEPSLGLAPIVVQEIFRTIRRINEEGITILLVEQNARYALGTAARGYVLQTGNVIISGNCSDLLQNPRIKDAYLGRGRKAS
jgi:branched-chain amino acid transport system ATP-binding protein